MDRVKELEAEVKKLRQQLLARELVITTAIKVLEQNGIYKFAAAMKNSIKALEVVIDDRTPLS